jgi:hypothetical protein
LVEKEVFKSSYQYLHGRRSLYWHKHDFVYGLHSASRQEFVCNSIRVQMFSENLMTRGFWNSRFLCCLMKGQTTIGMKHFTNFLDVFPIFYVEIRPEPSLPSI